MRPGWVNGGQRVNCHQSGRKEKPQVYITCGFLKLPGQDSNLDKENQNHPRWFDRIARFVQENHQSGSNNSGCAD
jgi:hypothetical protein